VNVAAGATGTAIITVAHRMTGFTGTVALSRSGLACRSHCVLQAPASTETTSTLYTYGANHGRRTFTVTINRYFRQHHRECGDHVDDHASARNTVAFAAHQLKRHARRQGASDLSDVDQWIFGVVMCPFGRPAGRYSAFSQLNTLAASC